MIERRAAALTAAPVLVFWRRRCKRIPSPNRKRTSRFLRSARFPASSAPLLRHRHQSMGCNGRSPFVAGRTLFFVSFSEGGPQ